jgi:mRNA interferase RelE/StbE
MKYEVKWTDVSLKQLEKLNKDISKRIVEKVEDISEDPFMFVKKLIGFNLYRLRVGDYRIIVSIEGKKMIIFVLEVGHRSVIYRKYK